MMVKRGRHTGADKDQWKKGSQRSGVGVRAVGGDPPHLHGVCLSGTSDSLGTKRWQPPALMFDAEANVARSAAASAGAGAAKRISAANASQANAWSSACAARWKLTPRAALSRVWWDILLLRKPSLCSRRTPAAWRH